jgi:hypothetical protein
VSKRPVRPSYAFVALAVALAVACGRSGPESGGGTGTPGGAGRTAAGATDPGAQRLEGGSGSAQVTYKPAVKIVERAAADRALLSVSSNLTTYVFDRSDPTIASLKAGDILFVKGLFARTILAVGGEGDEIAVFTERASLGEAIENGTVRLAAPIRFGAVQAATAPPSPAPSLARMLAWATPPLYAQAPDQLRAQAAEDAGKGDALKSLGKGIVSGVFSGWDTKFKATPGKNRLDVSITLTKEVGGFKGIITGEGYLADFDLDAGIDVRGGLVDKLEMMNKRVNGVMNFKWTVAKDSPGGLTNADRIKLPAAIEIPLYQYLDGFPLFLEISAALIIQPAITGGKQYSHGAFRVTYDGTQHFTAKQGNIDPDGHVTGDIKVLENESTNISALAPMGMVVAFAAPRIELTFGVSKVLKFSDIKDAAGKADKIMGVLAEKAFGKDALARLKTTPIGQFTMGKAVENALKSDAAAYLEVVTSSAMTHSGMSVLVPCTRTDLHLYVKVGASAQAFGQSLGKAEKEIFRKDVKHVSPPGVKLCESI